MSLSFFSIGATVAGLAALAGGLYWLQRLRVRHREVPVVTALFWREAVEETRARELRLRFRHPLAYLFILAICSALWLAAGGLQADSDRDRQVVLLLDGSAGMARGTRLDEAAANMRDVLDGLPVSKRTAIFCGASPRTLLLPGEELAWFDRRLAELGPEASPSTIEAQLFALAPGSTDARPVTAIVFGDAYLEEAVLDSLPPSFELVTAAPRTDRTAQSGITALGVTQAQSGDWAAVDLLVEVSGAGSRELALELGGAPWEGPAELTESDGRRRLVYRDLPANGALLVARLSGTDELNTDDEARFVLPTRRRVRVALDAGLPGSFAHALASDPGVELVDAQADVHFGGELSSDLPTFAITADEAVGVVLRVPADDPGLSSFHARLEGLDLVGKLTIEPAPVRAVMVGATLLDESRGWSHSRSFPLFVAEVARWLAGDAAGPRWVAAGRPVTGELARTDSGGRRLDPLGTNFTPPTAGDYVAQGRSMLAASLLDRPTTDDPESAYRVDALSVVERDLPDFAHWLALLAFVALLVEWVLVRRGRMP